MKLARLAALGILVPVVPAFAQPVILSGYVGAKAGYGTNPLLRVDEDSGSAFAGFVIAPTLTRTTALSSTALSVRYDRDQYFQTYKRRDSLSAFLAQINQLTEHLSSSVKVGYETTNNALVSDTITDEVFDPVTVGRRQNRLLGDASLNWQPSARDTFSVGVNGTHVSYGDDDARLGASGYDSYGGNASYSRQIDARTKIGAQVSASEVESDLYPASRSVSPGLTIERVLGPIWTFNGNVGLIFQHNGGSIGGSSTTIGFGASLCGKYPLTNVCLTGSRQSAPSGIGGIRTNTQFGVNATHELDSRSHLTAAAYYEDSQSPGRSIIRNAHVISAHLDYDRQLTQRLSAGVGGRYQRRELSTFGTSESITVTVNVRMKIGRLQ